MTAGPAAGSSLIVSAPGLVALERRSHDGSPRGGHVRVEPDLVGLCGTDLEIIDCSNPARRAAPSSTGPDQLASWQR